MPNMPTLAGILDALSGLDHPSDDTTELFRLEERLPPLLSVIAGMVDLIGFFSLGSFTAHVTGNLVVAAATAVDGGPWNLAQARVGPRANFWARTARTSANVLPPIWMCCWRSVDVWTCSASWLG